MTWKNIYTIIAAASILFVQPVSAQTSYLEQIAIENQSVSKKAGTTTVAMNLDLSKLKIDRNHLIVLTPVVASLSGNQTQELAPVIIKGTTRNRVLERDAKRMNKILSGETPIAQVVRRNGTPQTVSYTATLPYAEWQRTAQLSFKTEIIGCADCTVGNEEMAVISKILPDVFVPDYRFDYIEPDVETIKQRDERYSAHLNYIVGRWDLLPNFENNAAELAKVDKIINEMKSDKDIKITDFTISGYASPEDTYERNMLLSQRRAETFATYIEKKYGYTRAQFKVEWFGEDWDGLRKAVEASSLADKQAVLNIIDNVKINDGREKQLMELSNGSTYSLLLNKYFPPLRRNEYNIAFIARSFNLDEAKQMIKKKPKLLSLNEMFLVANTYPVDSAQYHETFITACKTFPNSDVACINAAVGELRRNNPDEAIMYLREINNNAQALNLIGIAYARKGDTARAAGFFNKARQQGNADAAHNAEQLQQYINDNL